MLNLKRILSCRGLLLSVLIGLASLTEAFAWSSPYSTGASPAGSQDAAVQPSYTPYVSSVSPVGASCAPSIANTTGNTPYSNAPSYAPTLASRIYKGMTLMILVGKKTSTPTVSLP